MQCTYNSEISGGTPGRAGISGEEGGLVKGSSGARGEGVSGTKRSKHRKLNNLFETYLVFDDNDMAMNGDIRPRTEIWLDAEVNVHHQDTS